MHLVANNIKDAWRAGKVASALFLDIQAAFPNTVKECLLHNMKSHPIPFQYIWLFDNMLTNCSTQLHFDNFLSDLIYIHNGMTQGCPLSMILYAYYNTDLIDIAKGKYKLSTGFIDDCAFVTVADTLDSAHHILRDMLEQPNGRFDWSQSHNSPFKLSKLAVMDFARMPRDIASSPLHIDKTNSDRTTTHHIITTTTDYKYLGVIFDPKLNWRAHASKVVAKATKWTQQLWRLARQTGGISPGKIRQLYNTVVVPAFTYVSVVWYVPPFKLGLHFSYKDTSLSSRTSFPVHNWRT